MHLTWQPAGFTFTLRLLVLLLVPLVGLGVLSIQRIENETARTNGARMHVDDARRQQAVAAIYGPAQLEQIALEGLAAIDEVGVPRDLVVSISGVDFATRYNTNLLELDASLDTLVAEHGDVVVYGDSSLGTELSFFRGALAAQRQLSNEERSTQLDVRSTFAQLDLLLVSVLAPADIDGSGDANRSEAGGAVLDRMQLASLSDVLSTAGERGKTLLDGLLDRSPETAAETRRASNRLDYAIERHGALLATPDSGSWNRLVAGLEPVPDSLLGDVVSESIAINFDPAYIRTSTASILSQLSFLEALESYSSDFHQAAVTDLEANAVEASRAALNTRVFAGAVAAMSLAILLLVAWSTLVPLRRLTQHAAAISDGSFDLEPLPERGPSDVRTLTHTMNSMAATLRGVEHEITDLAAGAGGTHDRSLPGKIGVSIARSFDRLEAVTTRLHASEQLASSIVEQAADAIWTIDEDGLIGTANSSSGELLGIPAAEQVGQPLRVFLPENQGEVTIRSASGESAQLLVSSSDIEGGNRPLTTVIAHDISERLRFEQRLAYQAHHDGLTGLPNRFAVLEALDNAADGDPIAVLFVDLDGFKSVNDTQGHLAGDRVLTEVGRRLSIHVRPGDFVGRLGGDEFVVILHDIVQDADAVAFGYRLIREIEQPYHDSDHLFVLSASIGIATFESGLADADLSPLDAIQRADSAVYAAKQHGRGRVEAFDEKLQAKTVRDAEIELELRSAVRNDELELHLQPVADTVLKRFTGAEALVRWNRPSQGLVPPGDFIPVAERSSLIDEISRWVLTTACSTLARWADIDGLNDLRIAVNIAGSHLLDGDLLADLDAALLLTGADPQLLEFELTETQLMHDHERAAAILQDIRARGITVAIDDFGTGYSSMAYLRQLPIDTLKIDRSFIVPLGDDATDTTVVDALLTIGHALGLSVVAEGIETPSQLEYVTAHGADRVQGFHLAHPMPIDEAERFLDGGASLSSLFDDDAARCDQAPSLKSTS
jgi:diguanylate cyclase (GGDEF)-like protein